jgi:hypothetical protein
LVVPNKLVGDEVVTDTDAVRRLIEEHGAENICAVRERASVGEF